jgi:hypothetical protein
MVSGHKKAFETGWQERRKIARRKPLTGGSSGHRCCASIADKEVPVGPLALHMAPLLSTWNLPAPDP